MALHLISVRINATEEVRASMHIEHDPFTRGIRASSGMVIALHLNPFRLQVPHGPTPLPPRLSSDAHDPSVPELRIDALCRVGEVFVRDSFFIDLDPVRGGDLLGREGLNILDRMVGDMLEERADNIEPFVVRYMRGGLVATWLTVQVLCTVSKLSPVLPNVKRENSHIRERTMWK
jgi:hypothetical protein